MHTPRSQSDGCEHFMPLWVPPNRLQNSKISLQMVTRLRRLHRLTVFVFFFVALRKKTERPGKRNQRVSISQGPEKPQGTQTAPHRLLTIHTPPFCLLHKRLRSVAGTDGDVSLGSFVVAIKGIPFPLSQRRPQNILRRESYILKQTQRARQKKRGGQIVAIVRSQKYFFPLA